jgi:hypothetical protein
VYAAARLFRDAMRLRRCTFLSACLNFSAGDKSFFTGRENAMSSEQAEILLSPSLSEDGRALMKKLARGEYWVPHLTVEMLDLIKHDFVRFDFINPGYQLRATGLGRRVTQEMPYH